MGQVDRVKITPFWVKITPCVWVTINWAEFTPLIGVVVHEMVILEGII